MEIGCLKLLFLELGKLQHILTCKFCQIKRDLIHDKVEHFLSVKIYSYIF